MASTVPPAPSTTARWVSPPRGITRGTTSPSRPDELSAVASSAPPPRPPRGLGRGDRPGEILQRKGDPIISTDGASAARPRPRSLATAHRSCEGRHHHRGQCLPDLRRGRRCCGDEQGEGGSRWGWNGWPRSAPMASWRPDASLHLQPAAEAILACKKQGVTSPDIDLEINEAFAAVGLASSEHLASMRRSSSTEAPSRPRASAGYVRRSIVPSLAGIGAQAPRRRPGLLHLRWWRSRATRPADRFPAPVNRRQAWAVRGTGTELTCHGTAPRGSQWCDRSTSAIWSLSARGRSARGRAG